MEITKRQLKRIIKESLSDDAYEAGYNDALRDRPHGSNPDMRDLDPRSYDHGFDKGTADRMDMQRPLGTRGFYEGDLKEFASGDDEMLLRRAVDSYVDSYMLRMSMNPGDPGDRDRVRRQVGDVVNRQLSAFLGE